MFEAVISILAFAYLRLKGVEVSFQKCRLIGFPRIRRHPGSRIIIEDGVTLNSSQFWNPIGLNHPVMLCTLAEGAIIRLGNHCSLSGTTIVAVKGVEIGAYSGIGANVNIFDTDFHPLESGARRAQKSTLEANYAPVKIGTDVWLGMGVLVLKGVTIGDRTIVGAQSLVNKSLQSDSVYAGSPARLIR